MLPEYIKTIAFNANEAGKGKKAPMWRLCLQMFSSVLKGLDVLRDEKILMRENPRNIVDVVVVQGVEHGMVTGTAHM
jgi:hypothetical protein